jgi:hypothetical protein
MGAASKQLEPQQHVDCTAHWLLPTLGIFSRTTLARWQLLLLSAHPGIKTYAADYITPSESSWGLPASCWSQNRHFNQPPAGCWLP